MLANVPCVFGNYCSMTRFERAPTSSLLKRSKSLRFPKNDFLEFFKKSTKSLDFNKNQAFDIFQDYLKWKIKFAD